MLFRMAFILGADMGEEWLEVGQELQEVRAGHTTVAVRSIALQQGTSARWAVASALTTLGHSLGSN